MSFSTINSAPIVTAPAPQVVAPTVAYSYLPYALNYGYNAALPAVVAPYASSPVPVARAPVPVAAAPVDRPCPGCNPAVAATGRGWRDSHPSPRREARVQSAWAPLMPDGLGLAADRWPAAPAWPGDPTSGCGACCSAEMG